ncbi:unnamed protein product [Withania somnifera]
MKKAYDSLEWSFLEQILTELKFPAKVIKWIMQCVTTVTYSVLAQRGVRQGDPLSPFLFVLAMDYLTRLLKSLHSNADFHYHPRCKKQRIIQLSFADDLLLFCRGELKSVRSLYACFLQFSKASGLVANVEKSSVYFGGVKQAAQEHILHELQFGKGDLPFRYLGVPLSTKRLSIVQCKPLIDKMLGRITSWTTRFLSYAGRAQLVLSVLFAIQIFWSQLFALPKKIIQVVESICRRFLWTGSVEASKKSLIAWEKLCCSKACGGLNFLDVFDWNKAAIGKLLWNLCKKKDKLWVEWIHTYYGKEGVWGVQAKQASWIVQRILKAHKHLQEAGYNESSVLSMDNYSIKQISKKLRGDRSKKWLFSLYIALNRRLATKDRLAHWGLVDSLTCPLCQVDDEDIDHLLFKCPYAAGVWSKMLTWQGINRASMQWQDEVQWAIRYMKGRSSRAQVYRLTMAGTIYFLWLERNDRIFKHKQKTMELLIRQIVQAVHSRGSQYVKIASRLHDLNVYPTFCLRSIG